MNYSIKVCEQNIINLNNSIHNRLCNIAKSIINEMKHKGFDNDYFKLTNKLSIFLNKRIHSLNKSEINYILYEYGFDNAITNYKKKYKIIDIINTHMLLYNLIYNNYFVIINLDKFEAAKTINSYIIANRDRHLYIKKLNIKKEEKYLIEKINKEIVGDDAKYILNNIVEKFINKSINSIK